MNWKPALSIVGNGVIALTLPVLALAKNPPSAYAQNQLPGTITIPFPNLYIILLISFLLMKRKRAKSADTDKNRRLDLFLQQLQIEEEKRRQIVSYMEKIAAEILQQKTPPKLRLKGI